MFGFVQSMLDRFYKFQDPIGHAIDDVFFLKITTLTQEDDVADFMDYGLGYTTRLVSPTKFDHSSPDADQLNTYLLFYKDFVIAYFSLDVLNGEVWYQLENATYMKDDDAKRFRSRDLETVLSLLPILKKFVDQENQYSRTYLETREDMFLSNRDLVICPHIRPNLPDPDAEYYSAVREQKVYVCCQHCKNKNAGYGWKQQLKDDYDKALMGWLSGDDHAHP